MHLYIGNPTAQHAHIFYRVPETRNLRDQIVPIGGQIRISGDLSQPAADAIINQLRTYGMYSVDEAERVNGVCSLIYSADKPVPASKIERVMRRNTAALLTRGREIREQAAIAENNRLEQALEESGRPEGLRSFEVSVVEENHDDRDEMPPIAEGVRVRRDADGPPGPGRPRGRPRIRR